MYKKILFILGLIIFIYLKITNLYAETIQIIPPKKPTLSSEEITKKISKNLITPLKKPTKLKKIETKGGDPLLLGASPEQNYETSDEIPSSEITEEEQKQIEKFKNMPPFK